MTATFAVGALLAAAWIIFFAALLGDYSAAWDGCAAERDVCIARNLP